MAARMLLSEGLIPRDPEQRHEHIRLSPAKEFGRPEAIPIRVLVVDEPVIQWSVCVQTVEKPFDLAEVVRLVDQAVQEGALQCG